MGNKVSEEKKIKNSIYILLATGFGLGYIQVAPASFSCAISVLVWYMLLPNYRFVYLMLTFALLILGLVISNDLTERWGKDPKKIVIDEYAGFLLPLFFTTKKVLPLAVAFLFFRIFDVLKPFPLRRLERLPGGWGVMLDDIGAGLYTLIIVLILKSLLNF